MPRRAQATKREIFPDAADPESARVTVQEDYNRAKRLIAEGLP